MIELSSYYKGDDTATICTHAIDIHNYTDYFIQYKRNGECFFTEKFPGRSIYYIEDAAENWALGIKSDPFPAK
tara:strand:+ start:313 stop:531 length:219 start_codon:yes stop_codon:yes gene_type:complete